MKSLFDLSGKVALVTGGSQGLGFAFSKSLAQAGANLCILSRTESKLERACKGLQKYGTECIWQVADITNETEIHKAVQNTIEHYGKIDILVDNAAAPCIEKPIEELSLDEWRSVIQQNVDGMFIVAKEVAKHMIPRREGKIIILCSIASEIFNNNTWPGVYDISKGAVRTMVKVLAANWCKYNINVNGIAPGYFMSDVVREFYERHPETYARSCSLVPCGRFGEPKEIGPTAVFLASDASSYMHGSIITVDGGRSFM